MVNRFAPLGALFGVPGCSDVTDHMSEMAQHPLGMGAFLGREVLKEAPALTDKITTLALH